VSDFVPIVLLVVTATPIVWLIALLAVTQVREPESPELLWAVPARYRRLGLGLIAASFAIGVFAQVYGILAAHDSLSGDGRTLQLLLLANLSPQVLSQRTAQRLQRFAWLFRLQFGTLALFDGVLLLELVMMIGHLS
jgi:hypothetical protein